MEENFKLKVVVMILCAILLMIIIIGPEVSRTIEASNPEPYSTSAAIEEESKIYDVVNEILQPKVGFSLKYQEYPLSFVYLVALEEGIKIRSGPSPDEAVIRDLKKNEKVDYVETVYKEKNWYHVSWIEKEEKRFGFIESETIAKRSFQFDKMHDAVKYADSEFAKGSLTYVDNYKNNKGYPPAYNGGSQDQEGNHRSQSAPGYESLDNLKEFSYVEDGELMRVLSADSQYTKVMLLKNQKKYFIPNKYFPSHKSVSNLNKAIVIDRGNQNQVAFEKAGEEWKVVSYTLATTGKQGKYHRPTPLGYYYGIEKRERFYYYKDGTTTIQGYAPYAIRFAGGAYVHGVPVDYKYNGEGQRLDPGKIEFSPSLGTIPLSHKCVRNFTSHAKFLYDWYVPGETIIIVIE